MSETNPLFEPAPGQDAQNAASQTMILPAITPAFDPTPIEDETREALTGPQPVVSPATAALEEHFLGSDADALPALPVDVVPIHLRGEVAADPEAADRAREEEAREHGDPSGWVDGGSVPKGTWLEDEDDTEDENAGIVRTDSGEHYDPTQDNTGPEEPPAAPQRMVGFGPGYVNALDRFEEERVWLPAREVTRPVGSTHLEVEVSIDGPRTILADHAMVVAPFCYVSADDLDHTFTEQLGAWYAWVPGFAGDVVQFSENAQLGLPHMDPEVRRFAALPPVQVEENLTRITLLHRYTNPIALDLVLLGYPQAHVMGQVMAWTLYVRTPLHLPPTSIVTTLGSRRSMVVVSEGPDYAEVLTDTGMVVRKEKSLLRLDESPSPAEVVSQLVRGVRAQTARADDAEQRVTDAEARHRKDIATIGEDLIEVADRRGWCSDYDDFVEGLNGRLTVSLPERQQDYEVEVEITYRRRMTVSATRSFSDEELRQLVSDRDETSNPHNDLLQAVVDESDEIHSWKVVNFEQVD
jgi:hypothetical protein